MFFFFKQKKEILERFFFSKAKHTFRGGPRPSRRVLYASVWICVCFFLALLAPPVPSPYQRISLSLSPCTLSFSAPDFLLGFYCLAPADCSLACSAAVAPPASAAPGRGRAAVAGSTRSQSAASAAAAAGQSAGSCAPAAGPVKECSGAKCCCCSAPSTPVYPISTNPTHCPGTHSLRLSLNLRLSQAQSSQAHVFWFISFCVPNMPLSPITFSAVVWRPAFLPV